jgi:hypothetical protein
MSYLRRQRAFGLTWIMLLVALLGVLMAWSAYQRYVRDQRFKLFVPTQAVVVDSKTSWHTSGYGRNQSSYWATDIAFEYRGPSGVQKQQSAQLRSWVGDLIDWNALAGANSDQVIIPRSSEEVLSRPSGNALDPNAYFKQGRLESGWGKNWGDERSWDKGQWAVGKQFTVFVNPYNDNDWSLTPGTRGETSALMIIGSLIALSFGGLFYLDLAKLFEVEATDPGPEYLPADDPTALDISEARHRTRYSRW